MKPFLALAAVFSLLSAYSQSTVGNDSMDAEIRRRLTTQPNQNFLTTQPEKPNEVRRNGVSYSGIFVQLRKTDRPLELINPAAPPEYGSSHDNTVYDPQTGRTGLKLF